MLPNNKVRTYIDFEFDKTHHRPISMALINSNGKALHIGFNEIKAVEDEWVRDNVLPVLDSCPIVPLQFMDRAQRNVALADYFEEDSTPHIVADYPSDIIIFCEQMIVGPGKINDCFDGATFHHTREDAYPTTIVGAKQHCAMWDAIALRDRMEGNGVTYKVSNYLFVRKEMWVNSTVSPDDFKKEVATSSHVIVTCGDKQAPVHHLLGPLEDRTKALIEIIDRAVFEDMKTEHKEGVIVDLEGNLNTQKIFSLMMTTAKVVYNRFKNGAVIFLINRERKEGLRSYNMFEVHHVTEELPEKFTSLRDLLDHMKNINTLIVTSQLNDGITSFRDILLKEEARVNYEHEVMNPKVNLDYAQSQQIDEYVESGAFASRVDFVNKAVEEHIKNLKGSTDGRTSGNDEGIVDR